jgi:polyphosphate kinase
MKLKLDQADGHAPRPRGKRSAKHDGAGHLGGKEYDKALRRLQTELTRVQDWVKATGQRILMVFEGRDAAGKGGTIRAITERCSPRVFRVVALPAPSDREKSQLYLQRYLPHFPAAGEVVIFDRSYYNRAGVERVLGFCTEEEHREFLTLCPAFERIVVNNGIRLIKYWLEVNEREQERRFRARIEDPMRQWKLSPTDLESRRLWYEYSRARDEMFDATDTPWAPWHVVRSDSKKHARLNCISHFLSVLPYEVTKAPEIKMPKRSTKHAYDDVTTMKERRWIPEVYGS